MATAAAGTSNSIYWLALALTPGLGSMPGRKLAERFPKIEAVFQASLTELEALHLQAQSAQHIALGESLEMAHEELGKALAPGAQIISCDGRRAGAARDWHRRHAPPTPYGIGMAERLACDPAARGIIIFSGMARGVDTAGHPWRDQGKRARPWLSSVRV